MDGVKNDSDQAQPRSTTRPGLFIPAVLLLLVFIMAARTPLDTDLMWHLRAGQATLAQGSPVVVDTFSHTRLGETWVNHSWLSQPGMYLLYANGGELALSAALASLVVVAMLFVYLQMEGHPLLRAFLVIFACLVTAPVWTPRPQITSFVLFALLSYLLWLERYRGIDRLWWIVPLAIPWSNLHGGYVLGFMLLGVRMAGELLDAVLAPQVKTFRARLRLVGRLALIAVLFFLLAAINPNGVQTWLIPFQTVGVGFSQAHIPEWFSPDFHSIVEQPFMWLLLAILAAWGLSHRRVDGYTLLSVILFAGMALVSKRHFGPFGIVAMPALARALVALVDTYRPLLEAWSGAIKQRFPAIQRPARPVSPPLRLVLNGLILLLLGLGAVAKLLYANSPEVVAAGKQALFPVGAVQYLDEGGVQGQLFNDYNWGGYILFEAPDLLTFVDGRTDLFGDEILYEYARIMTAGEDWEMLLEDYAIGTLLLQPQSTLAKVVDRHAGWSQAYRDGTAAVYFRVAGD
jgi:hypothetical protein